MPILASRSARIQSAVVLAGALGAARVAGGASGVSGDFVLFSVSSSQGAASFAVNLEDAVWTASSRQMKWQLSSATPLVDSSSGAVIATLRSASIALKGCSRWELSFEADAGAAETTFEVASGLAGFSEISSAEAQGVAYGAFNVRDLNNDNAVLNGLGAVGAGAFRAFNNGSVTSGTLYSQMVSQVFVGAGGTATVWQKDPPAGTRAVGNAVSSAAIYAYFSLSAGDRVNSSSYFDVNPDPADCGLDSDGDGRPDWADGCPSDADKLAGGLCGCGVSDVDSDQDGVADCDDNCDQHSNPDQADHDSDGVGDACEDGDEGAPPSSTGGSAEPQDEQPETDDDDMPDVDSSGVVAGEVVESQADDEDDDPQPDDQPRASGGGDSSDEDAENADADVEPIAGSELEIEALDNAVAPVCGATGLGGLLLTLSSLLGVQTTRSLNHRRSPRA